MAAAQITATLSNPDLIERLQKIHADPRDLLLVIGVSQMSAMSSRLVDSYSRERDAYRTGNLLRSLQVQAQGGGTGDTVFDMEKMSVTVGSSVAYAATQDDGGTIFPKSVKYLAVPLNLAVKVRDKWPRDFADDALTFRPNRKGGRSVGWLFDAEDGKLGLGTGPLFALVPSVEIEGKGMRDAAIRETEAELEGIYRDWIESAA